MIKVIDCSKKKYLSNHYNLGIGSFTNLGNTDSNKSYLSLGMDVNNQLREFPLTQI